MRAVVATSDGSLQWDDYHGKYFKECLWLPGAQWRTNKRQLPLIDGDTATVRNIVGSVRNIQQVGNELVGTVMFCSDEECQAVMRKVRDGIITDFKVHYQPEQYVDLADGETHKGIAGPCRAVTRWVPMHVRIGVGSDGND